jgi:hypothetical protein
MATGCTSITTINVVTHEADKKPVENAIVDCCVGYAIENWDFLKSSCWDLSAWSLGTSLGSLGH